MHVRLVLLRVHEQPWHEATRGLRDSLDRGGSNFSGNVSQHARPALCTCCPLEYKGADALPRDSAVLRRFAFGSNKPTRLASVVQ